MISSVWDWAVGFERACLSAARHHQALGDFRWERLEKLAVLVSITTVHSKSCNSLGGIPDSMRCAWSTIEEEQGE